jgi:hypothetical protein
MASVARIRVARKIARLERKLQEKRTDG